MTELPAATEIERFESGIEYRFPELKPVLPLHLIGRGFRSVAFETRSGAVVLMGTSADAAEDYSRIGGSAELSRSTWGICCPDRNGIQLRRQNSRMGRLGIGNSRAKRHAGAAIRARRSRRILASSWHDCIASGRM